MNKPEVWYPVTWTRDDLACKHPNVRISVADGALDTRCADCGVPVMFVYPAVGDLRVSA